MLFPALIMGEKKYTLDRTPLLGYHGEVIAEVCLIPSIAIAKIINDQRNAYRRLPIRELISIIKLAGHLLVSNTLEDESVEQYIEKFTYSTGLPSGVARRGLIDLGKSMEDIDRILAREIPEHCFESFDNGIIIDRFGKLAISPVGKLLGVIAPSNHPAINISWITALALKYSVVIKPGKDDPFTPYRVINALIQAGLNPALISMLPTDQANTVKIIDGCDRVIFYGSQKALDLFKSEKIIPRGSGNSKVFVDMDGNEPDEKTLNITLQSVIHDGGRRCTNASSIIVKGDAEKFAYQLAERMVCDFKDPMKSESLVGCFKNPNLAREIDEYINMNLNNDKDLSMEVSHKPRLQTFGKLTYVNPTLIICASPSSPLFGKELPFPFVTVTKAVNDPLPELSNSLAVALINPSEDIIQKCIREASIRKVIINMPTFSARIGDPHDGFLFNSLFRIKSYIGEMKNVNW